MPIKLTKKKVVLSGECVVDDAEALLRWLADNQQCQIDLSAATHLHTAVLQALAATHRTITKNATDPFLSACIHQPYAA